MLLQKKDNEGFGFVLRGAKGGTLDQKPHHSLLHLYSYTLLYLSIQALLCKSCSHTLSFAAQTPIEEFTPTPAFPALQYLESVDEGGVAWRAGLRMGDFLIEVKDCITNKLKHSTINEHYFWLNVVKSLLQHLFLTSSFYRCSLPAFGICVFRN